MASNRLIFKVTALLHYLYTGKVTVKALYRWDQQLLKLANDYRLNGLKAFVATHMVKTMSTRNVMMYAQLAQQTSADTLFEVDAAASLLVIIS